MNKRTEKHRLSDNPKKNPLARRTRAPMQVLEGTVKSVFYRRNVTRKIMANKYCAI